jgi:hypothetical protein
MMLTVEEYMFLRSMMDAPSTPEPVEAVASGNSRRTRRRKSAYSKAMSKELKALNARYKTKKGDYRKGFDAARIMKMAHKNVRRMMK